MTFAARFLPLTSFALLFTACATYDDGPWIVDDGAYLIGHLDGPEGKSPVMLDYAGNEGLVVSEPVEVAVVDLGMTLAEMPRERAEAFGLPPYAGLIVDAVLPGTPAEAAGFQVNDVVSAIDGRQTCYPTHMASTIAGEQGWVDGQTVTLTVWPQGDNLSPREESLTLAIRTETSSQLNVVPLESGQANGTPYAGVVARSIPKEWSDRLFGKGEGRIVFTDVVVGSPAWIAGFRDGDMVTRLDGKPIEGLEEFRRTVKAKGAVGQAVDLDVTRGLGGKAYSAAVALEDYSGQSVAKFPVVFNARNSAQQDSFRLGPWGSVASWKSSYRDSPSREPVSSESFSMLLGLIRWNDSPEWTGLRLLWFINLGSS